MKFGLRYASLGRYSTGPAAIELAQAAEAAGFDSIWTVEHVVVPHGYPSRYPLLPERAHGFGPRGLPDSGSVDLARLHRVGHADDQARHRHSHLAATQSRH